MKKNIYFLLFLLMFSFGFLPPVSTLAATPTINLELGSENQNSQTGKWAWVIKINTTNIPNGTTAFVYLYKEGVQIGPVSNETITNNYAEYHTDFILSSSTSYRVTVIISPTRKSFSKITPTGITPEIIPSGNGDTNIGSEDPITEGDSPIIIETEQTTDENTNENDVYTLLAPIGGFTEAPNNIGEYFNKIFLIVIGLCGLLAVIMIVIGGIQYMGDESIFGKTEAKSRIKMAILGLIIALGAYALLNTINPDLLGGGGVNIKQVTAEIDSIEYISSESFTQITGKRTLSASEYDEMGRKVAREVGIPFCAIRVILERESKGNPGAIGFDENVRNSGIPSRVAFVNSGKKYSGETFTPSSGLINKKGFINQTKSNVTNTPGLGIDWRFSKGLGLTQITLFPDEYFTSGYKTNPPGLDKKDDYPTRDGLTPRDLLDPEKNLRAGAKIWKQSWVACQKDIYGSWVGYGGGPGNCSTSNGFLKNEAKARTEYYNGCPEADKQVQ